MRAHSETVLRAFYDFHRDEQTGPAANPFPLDRSRRGGRTHAHHNPMEPHRHERVGAYRPKVVTRIPRAVPDEAFNEIFARLRSHRDRALVAFYVSTGARASELLSTTAGGVNPERQLISVVRKGTRAVQELPASTDAFVWLRLYQLEMDGLIPPGRRQPLWWTRRRPVHPLSYHDAHRMFERVNTLVGSGATLHSLRHTDAYRMAEDPALPLTDVQFVLGHAQLTTTQIYLTPRKEDVIRRLLAHHAEQTRRAAEPVARPRRRRATGPRPWTSSSARHRHETARRRRPCRRRGQETRRSAGRDGGGLLTAPDAGVVAGDATEPRRGDRAVDLSAVRGGEPRCPTQAGHRRRVVLRMAGEQPGTDLAVTLAPRRGRRAGMGWRQARMAWVAERGHATSWHRDFMAVAQRMAISAEVLRPSLGWLASGPLSNGSLVRILAATRDPEGFARLGEHCDHDPPVSAKARSHTAYRAAMIMAAKGGALADIVVGDVAELLEAEADAPGGISNGAALF